MTSDDTLRLERAATLALIDLEPGRRPDIEIAEEMNISRSTLCRIRKTEEYRGHIEKLTEIDDLTAARIRGRIKDAFENLLALLDDVGKQDNASLSDVVSALKTLARLRPALVSQAPSAPLALIPQEFHPATVLIQNAYFTRPQGEVVEGQAKVLPLGVEGTHDGE